MRWNVFWLEPKHLFARWLSPRVSTIRKERNKTRLAFVYEKFSTSGGHKLGIHAVYTLHAFPLTLPLLFVCQVRYSSGLYYDMSETQERRRIKKTVNQLCLCNVLALTIRRLKTWIWITRIYEYKFITLEVYLIIIINYSFYNTFSGATTIIVL